MRLFTVIIFWGVGLFAQKTPPFYDEVLAFKQQDSMAFPPPGQVLFIGSSSFRLWKDVQEYFPGVPVLNRAFGGSALRDVLHYQEDIIYPYKPSRIVIYCGENDLVGENAVSVEVVLERFQTLFTTIRSRLRGIPIVYVSIKPSPGRRHLMPEFLKANVAIRNYLQKQKRAYFVDVYHPMLLPHGAPDPSIFTGDSLHMNAMGYAIWQNLMQPYVKKN